MKWSHLPVLGGLYDQDPALLDQFMYIFGQRNKAEESRRKQDERKAKASSSRGASRGAY